MTFTNGGEGAAAAASYLGLDKVVALCADMFEEIQDADCAFVLDLLQHAVDDDVGSRAADPCTVERREQR